MAKKKAAPEKTEDISKIDEKTVEDVSRETKETEMIENPEEITDKENYLWSETYVLTDSEILAFVDKSGLVESKKKTYIQAGLAAVLCLVNLYSYTQNHRTIALILVLICAALCGAVLIVPYRMRKQIIGELTAAADEEKPTRLSSDGKTLYFGAGEDTISYSYEKITATNCGDFITLLLDGVQMICVPKSAVSDTAWEELCAHAVTKK